MAMFPVGIVLITHGKSRRLDQLDRQIHDAEPVWAIIENEDVPPVFQAWYSGRARLPAWITNCAASSMDMK